MKESDRAPAKMMLVSWERVLKDERENTREALPLIQPDMRLDCYYGGDHTFSHGEAMTRTKLDILQQEITEYLPSLKAKLIDGSP